MVTGLTGHSWTLCVFCSLQNPHFLTSFCHLYNEGVTAYGLNFPLSSMTWRCLVLTAVLCVQTLPREGPPCPWAEFHLSGLCRPSGIQQ